MDDFSLSKADKDELLRAVKLYARTGSKDLSALVKGLPGDQGRHRAALAADPLATPAGPTPEMELAAQAEAQQLREDGDQAARKVRLQYDDAGNLLPDAPLIGVLPH